MDDDLRKPGDRDTRPGESARFDTGTSLCLGWSAGTDDREIGLVGDGAAFVLIPAGGCQFVVCGGGMSWNEKPLPSPLVTLFDAKGGLLSFLGKDGAFV